MYLSPTQASIALKSSRQAIYDWIASGKLGTIEIAGRRLVVQDDRYEKLRQERKAA